jgi:hypothetical protein
MAFVEICEAFACHRYILFQCERRKGFPDRPENQPYCCFEVVLCRNSPRSSDAFRKGYSQGSLGTKAARYVSEIGTFGDLAPEIFKSV